jgi:hypothetical protein
MRSATDYMPIHEIKYHSRGHFFSAGATRFFNSRYPQGGWCKGDKVYFVTSEQFVNGVYSAPRRYTISVLNIQTGSVDAVGEFNTLSKAQAQTQLKHILAEAVCAVSGKG